MFNTNLLTYQSVKYKGYKTTKDKMSVIVHLKCDDGTYAEEETLITCSKSSINKIYSAHGKQLAMSVPANIMIYNNIVVAVELLSFKSDIVIQEETITLNANIPWNIKELKRFVANMEADVEFNIDLDGIFWRNESLSTTQLTKSDVLRGIPMNMIYWNDFSKSTDTALTPKTRYAILYQNGDATSVSSPIFSGRIGNTHLDDTNNDTVFVLDQLSDTFGVKLNFMIAAGKKLDKFVNFEELDHVLGITDMVVHFKALCLPKLPVSVKETCTLKHSLTTYIIFLLGLQRRNNDDLFKVEIIRNLLKLLLTKSLVNKSYSKVQNLVKDASVNLILRKT